MTVWEKTIIETFAGKYPASAAARTETARPFRLAADRIFPAFHSAPPDERESFIEAAKALEQRGVFSLVWERYRKDESLKTLICRNPGLLFTLAGKPSPKTLAEEGRAAAAALSQSPCMDEAKKTLFGFIANELTPNDAAAGIDPRAVGDLGLLLAEGFRASGAPSPGEAFHLRAVTPRALSVFLYKDSKRIEALLDIFGGFFARAFRRGIPLPDFSILERSFPETFIAGKIALLSADTETLLENRTGSVFGIPLCTAAKVRRVLPLGAIAAGAAPDALILENKETFFSLAGYAPCACLLYAGGHPNRAVRLFVRALADSGFTLFHAGDLDPDGILILQELREAAGKPITPVCMDAETFDRYAQFGKKLEPSVMRRLVLINAETRAIAGIACLIGRIEKTGLGIEQEIIDHRVCV